MNSAVVIDGQEAPAPSMSRLGPAPRVVVVGFGFWIFLLSDIIMFSAFFASYAVLSGNVNGGPSGPELFDRQRVLIETICLLSSSFSCGLMGIAIGEENRPRTFLYAFVTFVLGAIFLALEIAEFTGMIQRGAGPSRSAFLSAFFSLVGMHGLHVTGGLVWLLVMIGQVASLGFLTKVKNRLLCFGLFWHALDIVWVGVFTIVYLAGVRP